MALQEAIRHLKALGRLDFGFNTPDFHKAIKLGIEALKELQGLRENVLSGIWLLLPGETKN